MPLEKEYLINEVNRIVEKLIRKNKDYGDSFFQLMDEYGDMAFDIRISDKLGRVKSIIRKKKIEVEDENLLDTVDDIIGYCLLYKFYNDRWKK